MDHSVGDHDDLANTCAGAAVLAFSQPPQRAPFMPVVLELFTRNPKPDGFKDPYANLGPLDEGPPQWWHKMN